MILKNRARFPFTIGSKIRSQKMLQEVFPAPSNLARQQTYRPKNDSKSNSWKLCSDHDHAPNFSGVRQLVILIEFHNIIREQCIKNSKLTEPLQTPFLHVAQSILSAELHFVELKKQHEKACIPFQLFLLFHSDKGICHNIHNGCSFIIHSPARIDEDGICDDFDFDLAIGQRRSTRLQPFHIAFSLGLHG